MPSLMQEIYQPHVAKSLDRRMLPPTCPDHRFGGRYLHGSFGRRFTVRTSQRKKKGLHGPQEEEERGEGEGLHDRRRIEEGGSCESSSVRSFVRCSGGRTLAQGREGRIFLEGGTGVERRKPASVGRRRKGHGPSSFPAKNEARRGTEKRGGGGRSSKEEEGGGG